MTAAQLSAPPQRLLTVRREIDALLHEYCTEGTRRAAAISPAYERLWQALTSAIMAGGKRLRPYLAVLAYEGFGGREHDAFMRIAGAWELLHNSMLVHDDVIDRDYQRHGQLNVAGQLRQAYQAYPDAAKSHTHYAGGGAILAGDLLLAGAYHWIATSDFAPEQKLVATQTLQDAVFAVGGGELLDAEAAMLPLAEVDPYLIARYKTAQYSVAGPLLCGARLAGADEQTCKQLQELGELVGVAYQLVDDLLGTFGDEGKTGKPVGHDLLEGKRTALLAEAYVAGSTDDRAAIDRILAQPAITQLGADQLHQILLKTDTAARVRQRIAEHQERSLALAAKLPLQPEAKAELKWLITFALNRNA